MAQASTGEAVDLQSIEAKRHRPGPVSPQPEPPERDPETVESRAVASFLAVPDRHSHRLPFRPSLDHHDLHVAPLAGLWRKQTLGLSRAVYHRERGP